MQEFPKADILIGCYPCTGFSEGAKRRATGMKRRRDLRQNPGNYLYREFLRALRQVQPKFLFVENVRGMLTAANGWFLERQLAGFRRQGYKLKMKMLFATDYGVAQERRRVFIVGIHRDVRDFDYEFQPPSHGPGREHTWRTLRDALAGLAKEPDDGYGRKTFHGHYLTRNRKRGWDSPSYTIVAHYSHVPLHPDGKPMVYLGKDRYALQGTFNRRLTWRECAAIQELPRMIQVPGGLEAKFRVVGNAVPPPLARALIQPVVDFARTART